MPKYIFHLTNGKSIVLTDNSNDLDVKKIKYFSNFLSSNRVAEFNTDTDILLIKPTNVLGLQISLNSESSVNNYKKLKQIENEHISDDVDDDSYNDLNLNVDDVKIHEDPIIEDDDLGLLDGLTTEPSEEDESESDNDYINELKEIEKPLNVKDLIKVVKPPLSSEEWIQKTMVETNTILDKNRDGSTVFDLDKDVDPNDDLGDYYN